MATLRINSTDVSHKAELTQHPARKMYYVYTLKNAKTDKFIREIKNYGQAISVTKSGVKKPSG